MWLLPCSRLMMMLLLLVDTSLVPCPDYAGPQPHPAAAGGDRSGTRPCRAALLSSPLSCSPASSARSSSSGSRR